MAWFLVHFWGISPVHKLFLRDFKVVNQSQTTNFSENLSFATNCLSFWQKFAWVLIFLSFYLLEFFHKMRNDKPVLHVEGLRNPMQKFHLLARLFFLPGNYPLLRVGGLSRFWQNPWVFFDKYWPFLRQNPWFFSPEIKSSRCFTKTLRFHIYMFWVWPMILLGFSCLFKSIIYAYFIYIRDQSWRIFKFLPIYIVALEFFDKMLQFLSIPWVYCPWVFLRNGQETSLILYNGNMPITTKTSEILSFKMFSFEFGKKSLAIQLLKEILIPILCYFHSLSTSHDGARRKTAGPSLQPAVHHGRSTGRKLPRNQVHRRRRH